MRTDMSMSVTNTGSAQLATKAQQLHKLRVTVDEFVGTTFFAPMLEAARAGMGRNKLFHGGRGEEMFGKLLDGEFARRAGKGTGNSLSQALYDSLSRGV